MKVPYFAIPISYGLNSTQSAGGNLSVNFHKEYNTSLEPVLSPQTVIKYTDHTAHCVVSVYLCTTSQSTTVKRSYCIKMTEMIKSHFKNRGTEYKKMFAFGSLGEDDYCHFNILGKVFPNASKNITVDFLAWTICNVKI